MAIRTNTRYYDRQSLFMTLQSLANGATATSPLVSNDAFGFTTLHLYFDIRTIVPGLGQLSNNGTVTIAINGYADASQPSLYDIVGSTERHTFTVNQNAKLYHLYYVIDTPPRFWSVSFTNNTGQALAANTQNVCAYYIGSKEEEVTEFIHEPQTGITFNGLASFGLFYAMTGGLTASGEMDYTKGWGTVFFTGIAAPDTAGYKYSSASGNRTVSGIATGPSPEP